MERKAKKLSKEQIAHRKKVQVKNQRISSIRRILKLVLVGGFILMGGFLLLGVFGDDKFASNQTGVSQKSIPEVKLALNDLGNLRLVSGGASSVRWNRTPASVTWIETIGEGVEFELAASWTSFNDLEVKMVNSNIECEGMWKYQLSKDAKGTRIDLVEIVDMHNIGYKAYLTINSHLVDLEDLIDAIDAK